MIRNTNLYFLHGVSVIVVLSLAFFLFSPYIIFAADEDDKEELEEKLEELEEKAEKYQNIINQKESEKKTLNGQIQAINAESAKIEKDVKENEQEISLVTNQIGSLQDQIAAKEETLAQQQSVISHILFTRYKDVHSGGVDPVVIADGNTSPLRANDYTSLTNEKVEALMQSNIIVRDKLAKESEQLEGKKVEITDLNYQLEQRNKFLEGSKGHKEALVENANTEAARYTKKLSKVEEEQLEIQREIELLEVGKVGDFKSGDLPKASEAGFSFPVSPVRITQAYGRTSFSHNYASGIHNGVDFGNAGSTAILAAGDGKVVATGDMGRYAYGKWIAIDHDNGIVTLYGHLSKIKVDKGDKVDRGDRIGTMGNTGFSTGPHLHFTMFSEKTFEIVNSRSIRGIKIPTGASFNPMRYL